MKLYDSYSKKNIEINEKVINIYNCGPTVYNDIHIGNARPLIVFDVLFRYLKTQNIEVNFVHNLTDIDDKIVNKAIENKTTEMEVSEKYIKAYKNIRKELNTLELITPKVTSNIDGIIEYIKKLIDKGFAYNIDGNIYFNISLISDYGKLSNKKIDELENGERVEINDKKRNPQDFVLWKKTKLGIQWNTEWSMGRPGWHTECSYLIEKYFSSNLTIHGGGIDLKFPHHENENAQNIALHNHQLAKVWMHIGHVNIKNTKMSKSLNNFILVKDILEKFSYHVIRWFFYKTNYTNPLNYTNDIILECKNEIDKICYNLNQSKTHLFINESFLENKNIYCEDFLSKLEDDLNIVNSVSIIQKDLKKLNTMLREGKFIELNLIYFKILNSLNILGIEFKNLHNEEIFELINQYKIYSKENNYEQRDLIRKKLIEKSVL